jgi:UDP-N-acetylglucosamine transferase subunit ALG13
MAETIVVSLGTDHHPFPRLIEWAERYVAEHPGIDLFVQHGYTPAPKSGEHVVLAPRAEMIERYKAATVVVTQGGPGGIFDVASVGKAPIVVPRRPELGEHVDGHQIAFSRYITSTGVAVLAEDYDTFAAELTASLAEPLRLAREPRESPVERTAHALDQVVADVLSHPAGFVRWSRFRKPRPALSRRGARIGAPVLAQLDRRTG